MRSVTSVVLLFAFVYITSCEDNVLPSYIKKCDLAKKNYADCIKEQISHALTSFTKGIPELGVQSIDPVDLDDINIDGNGLTLSFSKAQMHGLSKSKLSLLKVIIGKEDENFTLAFKTNLQLKAKYVMDGRILILPIKGEGDSVITVDGIDVNIESTLAHMKGPKGEHFKLIAPTYKYDIQKTTFDFANLFNGNKELAATTIQFANENWRQLMDELAPPVIKQIVKTIVKVINKFFSKIEIDKLFLNYDVIVNSRA